MSIIIHYTCEWKIRAHTQLFTSIVHVYTMTLTHVKSHLGVHGSLVPRPLPTMGMRLYMCMRRTGWSGQKSKWLQISRLIETNAVSTITVILLVSEVVSVRCTGRTEQLDRVLSIGWTHCTLLFRCRRQRGGGSYDVIVWIIHTIIVYMNKHGILKYITACPLNSILIQWPPNSILIQWPLNSILIQ